MLQDNVLPLHDDLHHLAQISAEDLGLKNHHGQTSWLDPVLNWALNCAAFCLLQCSQRRSCSTEETCRNVQQLQHISNSIVSKFPVTFWHLHWLQCLHKISRNVATEIPNRWCLVVLVWVSHRNVLDSTRSQNEFLCTVFIYYHFNTKLNQLWGSHIICNEV